MRKSIHEKWVPVTTARRVNRFKDHQCTTDVAALRPSVLHRHRCIKAISAAQTQMH